jgi:hypothetical protein
MVVIGSVSKNRLFWLFSPDGREYSFEETGFKPVSSKELEGQRESYLLIKPIVSLLTIFLVPFLTKKKLFEKKSLVGLFFGNVFKNCFVGVIDDFDYNLLVLFSFTLDNI